MVPAGGWGGCTSQEWTRRCQILFFKRSWEYPSSKPSLANKPNGRSTTPSLGGPSCRAASVCPRLWGCPHCVLLYLALSSQLDFKPHQLQFCKHSLCASSSPHFPAVVQDFRSFPGLLSSQSTSSNPSLHHHQSEVSKAHPFCVSLLLESLP